MPDSPFTLIGRVVYHTARPRFRATFTQREDGGWESEPPEWLDPPPPDARTLARLARQSADFFAREYRRDWIQEKVIARAAALGLTAYAIAKACGWAVSENHVHCYLSRRKTMSSWKLKAVLRVLGLELAEVEPPPR